MIKVAVPNANNPLIYMGKCPLVKYININGKTKTINFDKPMLIAYVKNMQDTVYIFKDNRTLSTKEPERKHKKLFELFNFTYYTKSYNTMIDIPHNPEELKHLGECIYEIYYSNKEKFGDNQGYEHYHKKPYPTLFKYKGTYIISGGNMKVTSWIYN